MRTWWLGGRLHLRRRLDAIDQKLDRLLAGLLALISAEGDMMATLDDVVTQITGMKDVEDGLAAAIDQIIAQDTDIAAKLKAALAAGADPVKVQAIADALTAQTAALAAKKQAVIDAVTANT